MTKRHSCGLHLSIGFYMGKEALKQREQGHWLFTLYDFTFLALALESMSNPQLPRTWCFTAAG